VAAELAVHASGVEPRRCQLPLKPPNCAAGIADCQGHVLFSEEAKKSCVFGTLRTKRNGRLSRAQTRENFFPPKPLNSNVSYLGALRFFC
jgi:hypothetical protein